jgi:glutamyl-tRNA synthetase
MYDRLCRTLPVEESLRRAANEPFVIRLAVPDGETVAEDIVRGTVRWDNATLDDSVLLKSDGFPTYHLANVVDDYAMKITHVIRAEEWLPSLPKHLILYKAFGWKPPTFAHLPLILGPDRKKLSKRHGHVAALEYRNDYLPEAFTNFLVLMGWRLQSDPDRELFPLDELTKHFSLEGVRSSGAIFDPVKLNWLNREWMRRDTQRTRKAIAPLLSAIPVSKISDAMVHLATEHSTTRSAVAEQISGIVNPSALSVGLLVPTGSTSEQSRTVLMAAHQALETVTSWESQIIDSALHGVGESLGKPPSVVQWPIRIALSHQNPSPSGVQLAAALGKEETLRRITEALQAL